MASPFLFKYPLKYKIKFCIQAIRKKPLPSEKLYSTILFFCMAADQISVTHLNKEWKMRKDVFRLSDTKLLTAAI